MADTATNPASEESQLEEKSRIEKQLEALRTDYHDLLSRYSDYDAKTRQTVRWYVAGAFILGAVVGFALSFV